jgi:hypothetical protein
MYVCIYLFSGPICETRRPFLNAAFDVLSKNVEVANQQAKILVNDLSEYVEKGPVDYTSNLQRTVMRILYCKYIGPVKNVSMYFC